MKKQQKPRVGGISIKEGGWRLVPLPDDRVLKVLVPFLGNALCEADEKWITLKDKWAPSWELSMEENGKNWVLATLTDRCTWTWTERNVQHYLKMSSKEIMDRL